MLSVQTDGIKTFSASAAGGNSNAVGVPRLFSSVSSQKASSVRMIG
jgi:hypothetical protein